jgi:hypothetical protein
MAVFAIQIPKPPEPEWVSIFDNTRWGITPSEPYGEWVIDQWEPTDNSPDPPGGPYEVNLTDLSTWTAGFRPTKIKVTGTGFGFDFYLWDTSLNVLVFNTFYANGGEEVIDFSNNLDIDRLMLRNYFDYQVTNIEFFGVSPL